ncbi:MAG: hypothetical protein AB1345_02500 [Chloroflexota bacterium]
MGFMVGLYYWNPGLVPGDLPPTAVFYVIPAPLAVSPSPTSSPTESSTNAQSVPTLPSAGDLFIGAYVEVTGTEGAGLRVRAEPGLEGKVLFLGLDAEVFIIQDGPREKDGFVWWYLVAPLNPELNGWAVANYLSLVYNP